ncbi:MAG TPA: homocysteine S-methyltransferase family protein [Chthoniobacterales bacterium]|nr:homocysteine S-methyltransferase family protein [Chthoniobacterales bacterium]
MDLLGELETRVVCGDGAMGTLLLNAGALIERCLEELSVSEPERIRNIHEEYIAAGSRVITTNTFGANAVRLGRFGMEKRVCEINRAAVAVAKGAAGGREIFIAGNVGPLGITADEADAGGIDRASCFREQITVLADGGVDVIFFETFTQLDEMEIALQAKNAVSDLPEICCFACGADGRLRCRTMLAEAFTRLRDMGAKIIGVNCLNDPRKMAELLQHVTVEGPLAVYPTAGNPMPKEGRLAYEVTPESFAADARDLVAKGARLIGGCCGTTPAHIAALSRMIRDLERS